MIMTPSNEPAARPPRRGCAPSGTATRAKTRHAAGNARRLCNSTCASRQLASFAPTSSRMERSRLLTWRGCVGTRPVTLSECRDGVTIGIFAREFVRGAALQVKLQLALFGFGNYNRILRQRELRAVLSTGFSEKYAVPLRAAGRHVVDVKD